MWKLLPKRGNANGKERSELLQRYLDILGMDSIECVMGDREFIGHDWFKYLVDHNISYYMRIKENVWITLPHKRRLNAHRLFAYLNLNLNRLARIDVRYALTGTKCIFRQ